MSTHREIKFVRSPAGLPTEDCFSVADVPTPEPGVGEVLVETHVLSIDPYMRRAMSGARPEYRLKHGATMIGRGAGIVVKSRHPDFKEGDAVQSEFGWRERVVLKGEGLRKLAPDLKPLSLSLGIVGQSGATAYVGLHDIAGMKSGDTVVVSAAAGAVGSAVGQIAGINNCCVIGIAGGPEKCRHVVDELGFNSCVDYMAGPIDKALAEAVGDGVDVYFDNVGGEILEAVLDQTKDGARVAICGQISHYNSDVKAGLRNVHLLLDRSIKIQGFRVGSDLERRDFALEQLLQWWRDGKLNFRETVSDGFDSAPAALINMLQGGNYGKQVVRVV
ncbi:MAG: NADP-dependent oxidoreductase [Hyphomicrobiaceae bacterium TMED74]|nr:NADP-dependent oxidoreductase [Filomicrobium sp.]RPG48515.1 MAG: NADP-dependent oxidoreductase [Hyphomicrobiaceae bacterium TMED74]